MKKEPGAMGNSLPSLPWEQGVDIEGGVADLITRCAKLLNELENQRRKAAESKTSLLLDLLEVLDSLERTQQQAEKLPQEPAVQKWAGHVRTITRQLNQLLQRRGVVPFDTVGKQADPTLTEIIGSEERDSCLDEEVIEEIERGYLCEGKLLRRARVKVARKKGGDHDKSNRN